MKRNNTIYLSRLFCMQMKLKTSNLGGLFVEQFNYFTYYNRKIACIAD